MSGRTADVIRRVLVAHGVDDTQRGPHSWRCDHPDRYPGYCTCVEDIVTGLMDAGLVLPFDGQTVVLHSAPPDDNGVREWVIGADFGPIRGGRIDGDRLILDVEPQP